MVKVDFHIHSEYSDGEYSLQDIFKFVKESKISAFSITDHNVISSETVKLYNQAKKNGIKFIQGIEISTYCLKNNKSFHILGYSKAFNIKKLNYLLEETIFGYNERAKKIINKINYIYPGINLEFDFLLQHGKSFFVSRNFLANKVIEFLKKHESNNLLIKNIIKDIFIEEDAPVWMISPQRAIEIIKECGGISVLAHPGKIVNFLEENKMFLDNLVKVGLSGIETFFSSHTDKETQILICFAKKYSLCTTAGSDWHGCFYTPNKNIGLSVKISFIQKFLNKNGTKFF